MGLGFASTNGMGATLRTWKALDRCGKSNIEVLGELKSPISKWLQDGLLERAQPSETGSERGRKRKELSATSISANTAAS